MPPLDVAALRADTPGCANVTHLNNAGSALPPRVVTDTMVEHLRREEQVGGYEAHAEARDRVAGVYASVGELVHVSLERVALVESATVAWDRGLQAIAFSDPILAGDRMLVSGSEYASNVLPLLQIAQRTGASVEVIPDGPDGAVDVEAFGDMLDERVRIVSINHAPSQNGLVNDVVGIGDMLRRHGSPAWYLVDACQSVGQMPVDMGRIGCDLLSATGRKFLRGPRATGFLVVSQRMLDDLEPFPADLHAATWTSLSDYALADGAARFESWEKPYAALLGMGAAIDYALDCGIAAIAERIGQLAGRARAGLDEIPGVVVRDRGSTQSGIVTIRVDDPGGMVADLRARGINTSLSTPDYSQIDFGRDGAQGLVRISPHAYNTEAEIDQLITAVAELSR
ncbi:MAG: aminotransferase class V-fold PLP-dependent enzyme [Candidatus Nanopelagicales bacterium]